MMKTFRQLAMGLLALTLCFALPSCSDDDGKERKEAIQEEQRGLLELLNLKTNLCMVNLKGEPTEATFGLPVSEANTAERIYYTKDPDSAKKRYQSLFHSDTRCSEDGCTYTLANGQGTATFAPSNGDKGELAVATFDVPGLKGLVKKIHFIDYTQRGENSYMELLDYLRPGNIVRAHVNGTEWSGIALGPLKGSDDTWVLFTPSVQKDLENYRPTGFTDKTMIQDYSEGISVMDYIESFSVEEFHSFCLQLKKFIYINEPQLEQFLKRDYLDYWHWGPWNEQYFFFQVKEEEETDHYVESGNGNTGSDDPFEQHPADDAFVFVYSRYHMLLGWTKYNSRTTLWDVTTTVIDSYYYEDSVIESAMPNEFKNGLPLWTTLTTVTKGDQIEIIY